MKRAVKLPESMAEKAPQETVVVAVSGSEILVANRVVANVADALAVQDDLIQPLKAELDIQAARQVVRSDKAADAKHLTIMGDKYIPYRLLRKVMATSARAGYTDISFAVRQKNAIFIASSANFDVIANSMLMSASGRCSGASLPSAVGGPWSTIIMSC